MARSELIGLMHCPECGFADAEVRPDKSGSPYRFCPDCTAQYFSRGGEKAKALMLKVRPTAKPESPAHAQTEVGQTLPEGASETAQPAPPVKKKVEAPSWM